MCVSCVVGVCEFVVCEVCLSSLWCLCGACVYVCV